jgi:2-dehydropantoate 2-reductase
MRIAIIGTGGLGGYFGAQLAKAGEDVTFVARGEHLEAIRRHGLRIDSGHAPVLVHPANATDAIEEIGPVDLVLISVKLWDTDEIARRVGPHVSEDATVISLQNGVSKDNILRRYVPAEALIGGVSYISAAIASPGVVRHDGNLAKIVLGEFEGRRSARVVRIFELFSSAGVDVELSSSISEDIWKKFVFLVGLSSVTSATRQPVGRLRSRERTRKLLRDAMAEVVQVGRARGIRLPAEYADQQIAFVDTLPELMTSSMLTDLLRGNRLELPWLGESVTDMAGQLGVPTPVNELLAAVLDPYVNGDSPGAADGWRAPTE